jgi:hypothetical protein
MSKYRTPLIEELTQGLEYEFLDPYYPEIWIKSTITNLQEFWSTTNSGMGMIWEPKRHFIIPETKGLKNLRIKNREVDYER